MAMFPSIDYNLFIWKATRPDDPSYYSRLAFSGETFGEVLNRFHCGEQNLFLGVQVTFTNPISTSDLLARARETWEDLRFDLPTIAAQTEFDSDWNTTIVYRSAKSDAEVKEWSRRTVRLVEDVKDLDELRYEVGKKRIPEENGDQTFLYVLPKSDLSYGFLLHTHHTPFDGSATQILINEFLMRLANLISNPSSGTNSRAWGTESKNLPPPTSAILDTTEVNEGPLYEQGLGAILTSFGTFTRGIGFKQRNIGPGATRRSYLEISEEETNKLVEAVRALGGTVNQFAHAALCILCYLDNPTNEATPPDAAYVCFGIADSRNRLLPQHRKHPGYALGISAILISASLVASAASKGEKGQLLEVAKATKLEYEARKANPALLAAQPQAGEFFFSAVKAAGPPRPNFGFCFAGDGIGEKYMARSFEGSDGQVAATLDDYFTSLNVSNPGPFFRVFTWRGKLRFSADANEYAMPRDVVQGFLEKWVALLRLVL